MDSLFYFLATGLAAGILAGLLGIGGGIVTVPALIFIFTTQHYPDSMLLHLAIGTSLTAILFTSISSAWAHHREHAVDWARVGGFSIPLILGAVLGAVAARFWSAQYLLIVLGIVEILLALQIGFQVNPSTIPAPKRPWLKYPAAALVAFISVLVGIGGGLFMVPLLRWDGQSMNEAVATSSACGIPIAACGALGFAVLGDDHTTTVPGVIGYIHIVALVCVASMSVIGAQLGARWAHRIPVLWLQRVFAIVLFALGARILWRAVF